MNTRNVAQVGFSYSLTIQVVSVSGVLGSARKRSCYAMHQFLDFDPAETDTLAVSDSSRFTFMAGKASYTVHLHPTSHAHIPKPIMMLSPHLEIPKHGAIRV